MFEQKADISNKATVIHENNINTSGEQQGVCWEMRLEQRAGETKASLHWKKCTKKSWCDADVTSPVEKSHHRIAKPVNVGNQSSSEVKRDIYVNDSTTLLTNEVP
jgi:hypothetical protein